MPGQSDSSARTTREVGVNGTGNNGVGKGPEAPELSRLRREISPAVLEAVMAKAPAFVWTTDRELRIEFTLGGGLLQMGVRPNESAGRTIYEYLGNRDDSMPPIAAHIAALRGESRDYEYEYKGRQLAARTEPLRDEAGTPVGVLGIAVDITDLREAQKAAKELERELVVARKHEPLARLNRTRLSELTDVITALLGVSERLQHAVPADDARAADVDQLLRVATRGADLLRDLRDSGNESPVKDARTPIELDGAETILLVDDEPQVRGFVRRALEGYGYRVLEAGLVDEALALGSSYPGQIHLLLTDVVLPGMSGPQLAARLAPLRPEMRILYMTGYADDAIVHRGVLSAGQSLLVKPFTSLGLAHEVKKVLRI
jgi:CheY-like chemotaxis protein